MRILGNCCVVLAVLVCSVATGCSVPEANQPIRIVPPVAVSEIPGANLPVDLRPYNWTDRGGSGSCANASSVYNLQWAAKPDVAEYWRRTHAGGETASSLRAKHDAAKQPYYYTLKADPALLDWATRTRRSAVIWYYPSHAINFCGFGRDPDSPGDQRIYAFLCDNNRPTRFIKVERSAFLRAWAGYGGFGLALAAPPVPPPLYDAVSHGPS